MSSARPSAPPPETPITFGAFRLVPSQRQLTRDGVAVVLGGRAMDILVHLASHPGETISKDALIEAVWPGRAVEENNLTVQIAALRRALGETADGRPMIQTVTGRGYVFVAPVAQAARGAPGPPAAQLAAPPAALRLVGIPRAATQLIGRIDDLAAIRQGLAEHRLVTVTGIGGIGKTRVALEVAAQVAASFPDGVWWVDLATVTRPEAAAEAIAAVFHTGGTAPAEERMTGFLADKHTLLVLDSCEHLADAVATILHALLAACPRLSVLATSREVLAVSGERLYRLPVLSFPARTEALSVEAALQHDSIRLFVTRAAAALGDFTLTDADTEPVARICQRLDGIALAIEMAVPRLKVLGPAQLADRLHERFRILGGHERGVMPRHRTLRAMLDWSHELLSAPERRLLGRLSCFAGGADLAAVAAVAVDADETEYDILDRLEALIDKSLVVADQNAGSVRYRLLETVRQYAAEKAVEAGDEDLARRHAGYFAGYFEAGEAAWPTMPSGAWVTQYGGDLDNLRGALTWAFATAGDTPLALRLTAASGPLWWDLPQVTFREGLSWFDQALARIASDTAQATAARLWFGASWRDFRFGDQENLPAATQAAALFRAAGETAGLGAALWRAGSALLTQETASQAEACLVEAETVLRGATPSKWLALTLIRLGDLWFRQGRHAAALASYQEGFALSRATEFWVGLVNGGSNMAELLFAQGERDRALRQLRLLRDELPPSRRTPLMATLTAHLLLAGEVQEMRQVADEAIFQGAATGLTGALAWTIEAVALLGALAGRDAPTRKDTLAGQADVADLMQAGRLAGYARAVHPSVATRAGARKAVVERLDEILASGLTAATLAQALAEGGRWDAKTAASQARICLRPEARGNQQDAISKI